MRICITSNGPNLDSLVDPRFGRCLYFIFVDDKNPDKFEAVQNTGVSAMRGAGVTAAQIVVDKGAEVVISGNFGPNAFGVLSTSGMKILQAMPGTKIKDTLDAFRQGRLPEITQPFGGGFGPPAGPPGTPPGRGTGLGRRRAGPSGPAGRGAGRGRKGE